MDFKTSSYPKDSMGLPYNIYIYAEKRPGVPGGSTDRHIMAYSTWSVWVWWVRKIIETSAFEMPHERGEAAIEDDHNEPGSKQSNGLQEQQSWGRQQRSRRRHGGRQAGSSSLGIDPN